MVGASSVLENWPALMTAGPAPGVLLAQEVYPGKVLVTPQASFGLVGDDAPWINVAATYLANRYGGGTVEHSPATFSIQSQVTQPFTVSFKGAQGATIYNHQSNGTALYMHRPTGYGTQFGQPAQQRGGRNFGILIDGTNAGANAIGCSYGDGWGVDMDINVVNYTQMAQIALYLINAVFWSEKQSIRAHLMNNQNPVVFDANNTSGPGGFADISHEYNILDFYIFCNAGQNGVQIVNGCNLAGVRLGIYGNMGTSNSPLSTAALSIVGSAPGNSGPNYSRIFSSMITMKVEANQGNTFAPMGIFMNNSNNAIQECSGIITHSLANSVLNGAEFTFSGPIPNGDGGLQPATPAFPGNNQVVKNLGPDTVIGIWGGAVTSINIGGTGNSVPGNCFFTLWAGQEVSITYTGSPTWQWNARTNQF